MKIESSRQFVGRRLTALCFIAAVLLSGKFAQAQVFPGPNPWYDVSANPKVDCTGANDSTLAIQGIITAGALISTGATIFFPASCTVTVSTLTVSRLYNLTFRGVNGGLFGAPANWNLIFTCTTAPCLNIQSAAAIHFYDLAINFPSVTTVGSTTGIVDLGPCSGCSAGAGQIGFHHTYLHGPGTSIGPLVLDSSTNFVTFDNWSNLANASVAVNGATNNTQVSDLTIFDHVIFSNIGTAVIQNASVNWTISNSNFGGGTPCVPVVQYTVSGLQESNFNWINSSVTGEADCSSAFTLFSFPSVSSTLPGATGGINFQGGLLIANLGSGAMTVFSLGNGQTLNMNGSNICFENSSGIVFSLGTGVTLNVSGNSWPTNSSCHAPASFYASGVVPTAGSVTDNTGKITLYGATIDNGIGDGTALQHTSVNSCVTPSGLNSACNTTLTWPQAWKDSGYTTVCTLAGNITGGSVIINSVVNTTTTSTIQIQNIGANAAPSQWGVNCIGMH